MFCAGEFIDNQYTLEGTGLHDRVHTLGSNHRDDTWQVRAIWLKSDRYGLIGKSDLIEETDGQLYPVEYKRGHRGEFDNDELQVCAQALCLEDMTGKTVTQGFIYYAQSHQRQPVELTPKSCGQMRSPPFKPSVPPAHRARCLLLCTPNAVGAAASIANACRPARKQPSFECCKCTLIKKLKTKNSKLRTQN
jgi:hypothetical protein